MTKIVMTLMVRDEADIIAAMIEHHLAQGIDFIIATDNASTDGTREILQQYADAGVLEVNDDPRLEKQQAEVVTAMARRAAQKYQADWVINADADEFFFAANGGTVAEALGRMPANVQSFDAPVRNLMGLPLKAGSAACSHVWRDERTIEALNRVGLHAHPTQDCVHRASETVNVVQGNHATDLPLTEDVPADAALEVLHLPYRTWDRYRHRVEITAEAYRRSNRTPSPRHHGMRDARWLESGVLEPVFIARHPNANGGEGFVLDTRVKDELEQLRSGQAVLPKALSAALAAPVTMGNIDEGRNQFALIGPWLISEAEYKAQLEYRTQEFYELLQKDENTAAELATRTDQLDVARAQHAQIEAQLAAKTAEADALRSMMAELTSSRAVRTAASVFVTGYDGETYGRGLASLPRKAINRLRKAASSGRTPRSATVSTPAPTDATKDADPHPAESADLAATIERERERKDSYAVFQQLWQDPPSPVVLLGKPDRSATPLIMCLWNRRERIEEILQQLDEQVDAQTNARMSLRVIFWNNCAQDQEWYETRIRAFAPSGAVSSVEFVQSPRNIRGIGRFIAARHLANEGSTGAFLMLDDDEDITPTSLTTLLSAGGTRKLAGFWSWRVDPLDYWQRERAADGEKADYVATGGCVCDFELVRDDAFFNELPEPGLYIEDAWMSRFAGHKGWDLRAVDLPISFVLHETNQYNELVWDKVAFWKSLNDRYPLQDA
ncbi:glycosyltransferase family 2 protein [Gulosibacter bifidus]|uniref:Glycosyltransferase family 2 protein n=1 Tax=Gulosibacter bifidus TaxID=272239 RepID=A0ABW5RHP5_9MICO|nr:glycosyltransferase family 2 protein [Gulosibacter bifidus]